MAEPRWAPGSFAASLPDPIREALLGLGTRHQFGAGRVVMHEGGLDDHVELLHSGFVKVSAFADDVETLLAIRVPGDIVGETAALTGQPRSATVTACGPVTSSVIRSARFNQFLTDHPIAAVRIAATMGKRLGWANRRRMDFAALSAEVRLARVLIELGISCGRPTAEGLVIDVQLTQPEIASMAGVAEATAEKAIRDLRKGGILRTGYRRVIIVDPQALDLAAELTDP